ncbi:MAG: hypothetical protein KIS66_02890 [Fimbriimonadaceae bacterium]|nr:hypothetical protein [Fimbriimonadaceae bacterium]
MASPAQTPRTGRPEWLGAVLGVATFVLGVYLLWQTFQWAHEILVQSPEQALKLDKDKAVDIGVAGQSLVSITQRLLALVLMAGIGSMIATRGVKLYLASRTPSPPNESTQTRVASEPTEPTA